MNIDDLTIRQAKELVAMLGKSQLAEDSSARPAKAGIGSMIGQKVIVRTYSAGVWYGTLKEKCGNEVIIADARRMWRWWAAESISLSAVALYGIKHKNSKIIAPVPSVWLEAIELIPCSDVAIQSIEMADHVAAE